jgi:hypothetical protein
MHWPQAPVAATHLGAEAGHIELTVHSTQPSVALHV